MSKNLKKFDELWKLEFFKKVTNLILNDMKWFKIEEDWLVSIEDTTPQINLIIRQSGDPFNPRFLNKNELLKLINVDTFLHMDAFQSAWTNDSCVKFSYAISGSYQHEWQKYVEFINRKKKRLSPEDAEIMKTIAVTGIELKRKLN